MIKFAIITPTYNEAGNIGVLLGQLENVCQTIKDGRFTIVVADDDSPDGTADLVRATAKKVKAKNVEIRVLLRKKKDGLGRAYINAFKVLLKEDFDYILQMDADLSHDPKYIKKFVAEARKGRDFVAASRYTKGGGVDNWGWHRRILSWGGNFYTRLILGRKVTDYTTGFNMYSTKLLRELDMNSLTYGGYGFFIELKYKAIQLSKNFAQVPFIMTDRVHGKSKIPKRTILVNLQLVPRLRLTNKKSRT